MSLRFWRSADPAKRIRHYFTLKAADRAARSGTRTSHHRALDASRRRNLPLKPGDFVSPLQIVTNEFSRFGWKRYYQSLKCLSLRPKP
eukprot:3835575-Rhodomonas_salina.1